MDIICRTCLKPHETFSNIFEDSLKNKLISDLLIEQTTVKILKGDGLPTNICCICLDKLKLACSFKEMAIESDIKLHDKSSSEAPINIEFDKLDMSLKVEETTCKIDFVCVNSKENICEDKATFDGKEDQHFGETKVIYEVIKTELGDYSVDNPSCEDDTQDLFSDEESCLKALCGVKENEEVTPSTNKQDNDKKSMFCTECNRSFGYRYYSEIHIRLHTGDKPFKCDICGKGFVRRFQLNLHKAIHSDEKPFSCEICGKGFKSSSSLLTHMVIHSAEKRFKCQQCDKAFHYERLLQAHIRRHQNDRQYVCEICGKTFVDRVGLGHHMDVHTEEKNVACPICGKLYRSKRRMRQHLKQHSGERPFGCSLCDKRFYDKGVLNNHMRIHTGEKPFTCKICSKSFRHKGVLTLHIRTHTGETPYSCELCPSKFKYSHHLRNHMKSHK